MKERCILHSDANSFFASVEIAMHPEYIGKAVAVCGATEERHGIVLAKSEKAKKAGVRTGMVNKDARALCPDLIILQPHYDMYLKYSLMLRKIYARYTDLVEPFGLDECWLDVTGSVGLFGSPAEIAEKIRQSVKDELGITVSIGVSFNKVFAKLGSDLKKPDAVTELSRENFKKIIWHLPADYLIFIGRSAYATLVKHGIITIGDLASAPRDFLKSLFGVNGIKMWESANGFDMSEVSNISEASTVKSIGHGTTCKSDMKTPDDAKRVILYLSQDVGHRLKMSSLEAKKVSLATRDCDLFVKEMQKSLKLPTQSPLEIASEAFSLLDTMGWCKPLRSLSVRVSVLSKKGTPCQMDMFTDALSAQKRENLDDAVDNIREKFGACTILPASIMHGKEDLITSTEPIVSFSYMKR